MRNPKRLVIAAALLILAGFAAIPGAAQESGSFNGYVQSGTCAGPTDEIRLKISTGANDYSFNPYTVRDATGPDGIYFGARTVPGFSQLTLLGESAYSMVITDRAGAQVACGDIHLPDQDEYIDQGLILISLEPIDGSGVNGVAIMRSPVGAVAESLTTVEVILVTTSGAASAATHDA
ncbi:MAG: hypothetical protein IT334_13370 [Thermomicrobiales bacterium]|nr:hypothetical protein [Thermomicrobiales bacterium]